MLSTRKILDSRRWCLGLPIICSILCAACGTTITSDSISSTPYLAQKELGVIYQMSKPQFTIATSQPTTTSGTPKYTLQMQMIPDPDRRFAVTVNPGWFNKADVSITLNGNGALSALSETSQEQITPTIAAIGQFVSSLVGAAATAAGKTALLAVTPDVASNPDIYGQIELRFEAFQGIPNGPVANTDLKMATNFQTAARAIKLRLDAVSPKSSAAQAGIIKALTPQGANQTDELAVLKVIADPNALYAATASDTDSKCRNWRPNTIDSNYATAAKAAALPSAPALQAGWKWFAAQVDFALKNQDLTTLNAYLTYAPTSQLSMADRNAVKAAALALAQAAKNKFLYETTFPTILGPIVADKTPAQQIYAHAQVDTNQITALQAKLLGTPGPARTPVEQQIEALTKDLDETIGAGDEYKQITTLQEFLRGGPPSSANSGQSSPMNEYNSARAQLDQLQTAVTLKLSSFASSAVMASSANKPSDWTPTPVDLAFTWNIQREKMEGKPPAPQPILVPTNEATSNPTPMESMVNRVVEDYGPDPSKWPKYVVIVDKVQP